MSKLIFTADESTIFDASVYTIGPNQVRIVFTDSVKITDEIVYSGFITVNEYNHMKEADFTDYIYKYRDTEQERVYEIDNNDEPYVPPVPPTPPEPPVPPTPTLPEVLSQKIAELSNACRNEIESGVAIDFNGVIEHFAYSLSGGDQNNIDDLFNTMIQTLSGQYYHPDGGSCRLYSPAEIFYIYFLNKANTQDAVTYYNQMSIYLETTYGNAEDTEENRNAVSAVYWKLTPLTGSYLELYEAVLAQGQTQMAAYKASLEEKGVDFSEPITPVPVNPPEPPVNDDGEDEVVEDQEADSEEE